MLKMVTSKANVIEIRPYDNGGRFYKAHKNTEA